MVAQPVTRVCSFDFVVCAMQACSVPTWCACQQEPATISSLCRNLAKQA